MVSWNPRLREHQDDVNDSWEEAAAKSVEAVQNSGFLKRVVEVQAGSVVGAGLRFSSRPDGDTLGWNAEQTATWARKAERAFRAWADNPYECDAGGRMTFAKMQQAAFASYKCYGEVLALLPIIPRLGAKSFGRIMLLPPNRLSQVSDSLANVVQGVRTDDWGMPIGYRLKRFDKLLGWQEQDIAARNPTGRIQIAHIFDSSIAVTRGISPMANILKVSRQVDQYADATLTSALIQTIFAAVLKTNIEGIAGFDGLMTKGDTGILNLDAYATAKGDWYDGAQIDLTQHGRIAQLFPNDELTFTEAKQPGQQYDQFMGWLMREIAAGCGTTYESTTGDYRGATYSSIRMAGAIEWQTVIRIRDNIVIPFCNAGKNTWMDEAVMTGRLEFPGGPAAYFANREAAQRGTWSGPAQPQADDFKAARAHEVLKGIQSTTLAEISSSYGRDWDDDARQRAEENRLHEELGLPLPWSPTTVLETKKGLDLALTAPDGDGSEPIDSKKRDKPAKRGVRDPGEREPANASADELNAVLENEIEESITEDENGDD